MNPTMREQFAQALRDARARLVHTVAATAAEIETLEARDVGPRSDAVTSATATVVLTRLDARDRQELEDIVAAQARLTDGTFGICVGCGKDITVARLRALPSAAYCISCEMERESRPASR
jgi:DnaK suppressor protein